MNSVRLTVAAAMAFAVICAACRTPDGEPAATDLDGVILPHIEMYGALHKVHDELLKVCVVDLQADQPSPASTGPVELNAKGDVSLQPVPKDENLLANTETMIRIAYATWLTPLRKFTGKDVIKHIQFLHPVDGCKSALAATNDTQDALGPAITDNKINKDVADITVMISKDVSRANVSAHRPGETVVRLNREALFYTTILHELGHTLGIDDAYDIGPQPISIMNKQAAPVGKFWNGRFTQTGVNPTTSGALYADDVYTLKQAYCALYAKVATDVCGSLPFRTYNDSNFHHLTVTGHPVFDLTSLGAKGGYVMRQYRGETQKLFILNELTENGPLTKAGLKVGDLLIAVGALRVPSEPGDDPLADILRRTYDEQAKIIYCRAINDECPHAALAEASVTLTPVGPSTPKDVPTAATESGFKVDDVVELAVDAKLKDGEAVLAEIPKGTLLPVTALSPGWVGVTYLNKTGWVLPAQIKLLERY